MEENMRKKEIMSSNKELDQKREGKKEEEKKLERSSMSEPSPQPNSPFTASLYCALSQQAWPSKQPKRLLPSLLPFSPSSLWARPRQGSQPHLSHLT